MNGAVAQDLFATSGEEYRTVGLPTANSLLADHHYLGASRRGIAFAQLIDGNPVAVQVWIRTPTSRHLPLDGSWWELCRWCITPAAGQNAGSRQHGRFVRWLKQSKFADEVTTLVSYSDPSVGHSGALYKACNWLWRPTWHRLTPPPTGNGSWDGENVQSVKDRWVFVVNGDSRRENILSVKSSDPTKTAPHIAQKVAA